MRCNIKLKQISLKKKIKKLLKIIVNENNMITEIVQLLYELY